MRVTCLATTTMLLIGGQCFADTPARGNGVLCEMWTGIHGDRVRDLTGSIDFADPADEARVVESFAGDNLGTNYGSRWTALLSPPTTGDYTFWLASDDGGELLLSPNADKAGLRQIARVDGYTSPQAWDSQPAQRSQSFRLTTGQSYRIQALHKQGGGGNHLAVAWEGPGIGRTVITGEHLQLPEVDETTEALVAATLETEAARAEQAKIVEGYMSRGETMPAELVAQFDICTEGPPPGDTGINILIDQAHEAQFSVLWGLRGALREQGYRACSSLAALDSVLTRGNPCRVRVSVGGMEPFGWWPAAEFSIVVTSQHDLNAQSYTGEEREALLRFVRGGGGLLVIGGRPGDAAAADGWSLNTLLGELGAKCTPVAEQAGGGSWSALGLTDEWHVLRQGETGTAIRARRTYGRGRVVLAETSASFTPWGPEEEGIRKAKLAELREMVDWLAEGRDPVGGDWGLPHHGGAGIFPELEADLGGVVVYYAGNQKPDVVECVTENVPAAADQLLAWLPTRTFAEPYVIVICAGGGGGWAIGARPKAAAVIDYRPISLLGVFAHEMAHTMGGPGNANGDIAGQSPHHNQGEAHAGWFQGKIGALFGAPKDQSNRNCNSILDLEREKGRKLDLATEYENEVGREAWGGGGSWTKIWWIFQKLDDRYGPTWYPRWYWVRSTRWMNEPGHVETWDEMVEDMSIAVGEDLFPFFRGAGTNLSRERLESIGFQGEVLKLPVAPIDQGPAGNVCLDPIGDYTQAIAPSG